MVAIQVGITVYKYRKNNRKYFYKKKMSAPLPRRDLLGTHYAPDCAEVLAKLAKADMKGWLLF